MLVEWYLPSYYLKYGRFINRWIKRYREVVLRICAVKLSWSEISGPVFCVTSLVST